MPIQNIEKIYEKKVDNFQRLSKNTQKSKQINTKIT